MTFRKLEAQRLAQENKKMNDRLSHQTSLLKLAEFEKDFKQVKAYKRMRSKSHLVPTKSKTKLPPIKANQFGQSSFISFELGPQKFSLFDPENSPYMREFRHYESHRKPHFQSLTHRPLHYSTLMKLDSIAPSPDLGMDEPE